MNIIDFIIGALLMNGMPHFIFGITKTRFLGLFGFSPSGNILYGLIQFIACFILYLSQYHIKGILNNGIFIGSSLVIILYFLLGKTILKFYNRR